MRSFVRVSPTNPADHGIVTAVQPVDIRSRGGPSFAAVEKNSPDAGTKDMASATQGDGSVGQDREKLSEILPGRLHSSCNGIITTP